MNEEQKPQLFSDNSQAVALAGDAAGVARATQEVQAALVIAKRFPRDEIKAIAKIKSACGRRGLAEVSEYEYSRSGTRITGPTIDLIIAIANRWGNILYGWDEVERSHGQSRVRCYAWDIENNGRAERTFFVKHWRDTQAGGYELTDERDIYEMLANHASRRVRACLEQVIDQDIIELAIDACRETLKKGQSQPLRDRAAQMVVAFLEFGVTQSMIERRLGNKLDAISENQLASLRKVYRAIKDGVGQREDYFKAEPVAPSTPPAAAAAPAPEVQPQPAAAVTPADPAAPPDQQPPTPKPKAKAAKPPAETPLAKLREACAAAKIGEGQLLGFLSELGATDGSVASLEELQMAFPKVVQMTMDNWGDISNRIKGVV